MKNTYQIASAASAAVYAAQLAGKSASLHELIKKENEAWRNHRLSICREIGYFPMPSEKQQLGFSSL